MVALLTSDPIYRSAPSQLRPPGGGPVRHLQSVPAPGAAAPRRLAVPSNHEPAAFDPAVSHAYAVALAGVVIVAALVLLIGLRTVQGQPPSGSWADVQQAARFEPPVAHRNDAFWVVQPGQTLWGIAESVAPAADRREVVQILAEANGGSSIWAGQKIVIPAGLESVGVQAELAVSND